MADLSSQLGSLAPPEGSTSTAGASHPTKKKKSSWGWNYFTAPPASEAGTVKLPCGFVDADGKQCGQLISYKRANGTKGLIRHLSTIHKLSDPGVVNNNGDSHLETALQGFHSTTFRPPSTQTFQTVPSIPRLHFAADFANDPPPANCRESDFFHLCSAENPRPDLRQRTIERDSGACIVCGFSTITDCVQLVVDRVMWVSMAKSGTIPNTLHQDDPRNYLTLCPNHAKTFQYSRWCVDTSTDIPTFYNISRDLGLDSPHGTPLRIDLRSDDAPLKNLLIAHAQRAYMTTGQFRANIYNTENVNLFDLFRGTRNSL